MNAPAYRINGDTVTRQAFYTAACDPARSVVVEACAGAGKTWMLVSRILRALLEGAQPQEVLAITFTRKAAGEMRARLNQWLQAFAHDACSDAEREAELQLRGLSAAQAQQLAPQLAGLHAKLLAAGRPPQIHTFHRWFFQLLRAAPLELLDELGLSADMQLVEDWSEHEAALYRRFHGRVMADAALQDDFDALVLQHGRSQLRKWLDAAWQKRVELSLADASGSLEHSVPPVEALWPQFQGLNHPAQRLLAPVVREVLWALAGELAQHSGATARKQGEKLRLALEAPDVVVQYREIRSALYTADGGVRKKMDSASLPLAVAHLDDIHAACEQHIAHERHLRMVRLSRVLLDELARFKRQRGLADMADLELCALRLLRDSSLAGWVQERLDAQIRHLLIDEFQDTSPLQWHALHAWLSSYAGAGGGASGQRPPSVFIVGDPKQSIYRFRRAEPKVFEAAQVFVRQALGGLMLACDHTHRNAPAVLQAVNAVFEASQSGGDFSGFRAHTTELASGTRGAVWSLPMLEAADDGTPADLDRSAWRDTLSTPRHVPEESRRQAEARQVAQAIQAVVQGGVLPQDIMVLGRKRSVLRAVQDELQCRGLPFASVGDYPLAQDMAVRDLLAVLDVLVSPQHRLSLAQALRSPIFGVDDDELIALATQALSMAAADAGLAWWQALIALRETSPRLQRAATLLSAWQRAAQQLPPHDLLDRIVGEGEVRERIAAACPPGQSRQALAAVDALLAQALILDGARYATPYNFVRALRRRSIEVSAPVPQQAIELLTVHGAKGLESPWVFLVDTDPLPQRADSVTLVVDWPVESAAPLACAFVYSTANCPPSLRPLLEREIQARDREELNGLYVAMTRAKSHLVVSATPGASRRAAAGVRPSWWQRLKPLAPDWVAPLSTEAAAHESLEAPASVTLWQLPRLTRAQHQLALIDEAGAVSDPAPASAGALGEAVHLVLQWASHHGDALRLSRRRGAGGAASAAVSHAVGSDWQAWVQRAARSHQVAVADVAHWASRIWNSPECQRFFSSPALGWTGNEVPMAVAGRTVRIDRLVQLMENDQATWWVLDYKLHPAPHTVADYREQLALYRAAVQASQPEDHVNCAFITGEGRLIVLGDVQG